MCDVTVSLRVSAYSYRSSPPGGGVTVAFRRGPAAVTSSRTPVKILFPRYTHYPYPVYDCKIWFAVQVQDDGTSGLVYFPVYLSQTGMDR